MRTSTRGQGGRGVLLEVTLHDIDQLLGGDALVGIGCRIRSNDVEADMVLEDFGHERVDSSAARGEDMEGALALRVRLDRLVGGRDLALDPPDTVQELLL